MSAAARRAAAGRSAPASSGAPRSCASAAGRARAWRGAGRRRRRRTPRRGCRRARSRARARRRRGARRRSARRRAAPSARRGPRRRCGWRASARRRGRRPRGDVERERAGRGLVLESRARELDRDRAAEPASAATASSSPVTTRPVDDGDAGGAQERLGLVLREPAAARGARRWRRREPMAATTRGTLRPCRSAAPRRRAAPGGRRRRRGRRAGPAIGGDARLGEAPGGGVVEELGERGGDEHGDGARGGAVEDAVLDRLPARARGRRGPAGGRRRRAPGRRPGRRRRARRGRAATRGRPRSSPCSRAGWRSWRRPAGARAARRGPRRERRQVEAEPLRLVGAEPRVAARAGEDRRGRGRAAARRGPPAPWRARAARAGRPPRPRRPPPRARGTRGGRRPPRRCARPRRRRPTADAPTFSTATPTPASAQAASASHRRAPSPASSISSAIERTSGSAGQVLEVVRRGQHRLVPARDRGVQPQPAARRERVDGEVAALRHERDVARLRGTSASPHSAARLWSAISPSQLGPQTGSAWRSAAAAQRGLEFRCRRPRGSPRHRPPRRRTPSAPACSITPGTPGGRDRRRRPRRATPAGRPAREARDAVGRGAPRVDAPDLAVETHRGEVEQRLAAVGLPCRVAPTTAIERGWKSRDEVHNGGCARRLGARARGRRSAAGSRSCPPRCGPRAARAGSARRRWCAGSRGRRTPGPRGRRSARRPRTRTASPSTPWRARSSGRRRRRPAARPAASAPPRGGVGGRVREREGDALVVHDPAPALLARSAHAVASSSSRHIAPTPRAAIPRRSSVNHARCSSSPAPTPPITSSSRDLDALEADRRVAVRIGVRERRVVDDRDPRQRRVDEEQRRALALGVRHDDVDRRDVAGGDEPLLAVDHPAAVAARRAVVAIPDGSEPACSSVTA